jgi:tRNA1(Val) A37 N6-methylase TrmN6
MHHWDPRNWKGTITKKPDLIFFAPPYFSKKEKEYEKKANEKTPSISSYTKEEYERFLKGFSCWPIKTQSQRPAWPS